MTCMLVWLLVSQAQVYVLLVELLMVHRKPLQTCNTNRICMGTSMQADHHALCGDRQVIMNMRAALSLRGALV